MGKSKKKRKKKRKKAKIKRTKNFSIESDFKPLIPIVEEISDETEEITFEYVEPELDIKITDNNISQSEEIQRIFSNFIPVEEMLRDKKDEEDEDIDDELLSSGSDSDSDDEELRREELMKKEKSKKQKKKESRYTISELKSLVDYPELVEQHDCNSHEPLLLIELKARHNAIPVARHWKNPKRYLQSKRGIQKPPFQLPDYIQDTGIEEIRNAIIAKNKKKSARQLMRERMDPKMGKNDLDYQIIHDAFFKYQTKPPMSRIGQVYQEGQEALAKVAHLKPGKLSKKLKQALGMPEGAPPPWLINMQRYGPPPNYHNLRIPGVNAPIPPGAKWGYHPGGYGAPPRDANGKLLYKTVFSTHEDSDDEVFSKDLKLFGEKDKDSDEEDDSDEEENLDPMSKVNNFLDEETLGKGVIIDKTNKIEEDDEDDEEIEEEGESDMEVSNTEKNKEEEKKLPPPPPMIRKNQPRPPPLRKSTIPPPPPKIQSDIEVDIENEVQKEEESFYRVLKQKERTIDKNTLVESNFVYDMSDERKRERRKMPPPPPPKEKVEDKMSATNINSNVGNKKKRKRKWDLDGSESKKKKFKW